MHLKVNCLWLQHCGFDEGGPTWLFRPESRAVWFDVVVFARRSIGPPRKPGVR